MEKKQVSKRLYVGGLGHTVSKAELQERFGKFGRVLDVEIITRKDEQGNPTKTFAYVTVSSSEADLRKCISVLNKTKWGGRTLQIEFAKESFLHRNVSEIVLRSVFTVNLSILFLCRIASQQTSINTSYSIQMWKVKLKWMKHWRKMKVWKIRMK
uniref:Nucleolar protein 8 n=1 Tax=Coturnix japonica TaxID=93934 RepID=A0A8C2TN10_COTJA